jgi:hypothetical protein
MFEPMFTRGSKRIFQHFAKCCKQFSKNVGKKLIFFGSITNIFQKCCQHISVNIFRSVTNFFRQHFLGKYFFRQHFSGKNFFVNIFRKCYQHFLLTFSRSVANIFSSTFFGSIVCSFSSTSVETIKKLINIF